MAFGFGGSGGGSFGSSGITELLEIETEALGFHAIAGDAKVQLIQSWPSDALPPPTSSLLAVASKRGLLAAGGPTSVVIASTEAVRQAYNATGDNIKPFTPQLTLELGIRISQVAFSSDESVLVASAEQGGGLAVYDVEGLLKGNTQSKFEIPTAQTSIRALVPNPGENTPELFAVVTVTGQLLMAEMKGGNLSSPLRENVSCVAWSNKGKQLVAGLSNGSAVQMTASGEVKNELPRPQGLEGNQHVSALAWIDNDTFLVVHTPTDATDAMDSASTYHIINRNKAGNCEFLKLPEICSPFGLSRFPASQFVQRLRDFPPALQDIVIMTSSASDEVGLFTRSKTALSSAVEDPAKITDVFTMTSMANDSRRAALPMAEETTSPIGMALDLSSKTAVHRPLPGEEMDESQTPLPALMILNNMGVLAAWWVVYAESVRTGTAYPGLTGIGQSQNPSQISTNTFGSSNSLQSTLTQPSFGAPTTSAMAIKPATSGFSFSGASVSNTTVTSAGTPNTSALKPAFGAPSALGSTAPAFGAPSALGGRASAPTAMFGATSGIGSRASPWATPGSGLTGGTTPSSIFGQSSLPASNGSTSGFASVPSSGGFAAVAKGPSIFGSQTSGSAFGSTAEAPKLGSAFGSGNNSFGSGSSSTTASIFGAKPTTTSGNLFGSTGNFNLGSAWKNNNPQKPDSKPQESSGGSLFGGDFGNMLGEASKTPAQATSEEREMSDEMSDSAEKFESPINQTIERATTTPAATPAPAPAPAKFFSGPPVSSGLFGTQAQQKVTPALVSTSKPTPSPLASTDKTEVQGSLPIPPDTTSKATFTPTTSSEASSDSILKSTPENSQVLPATANPASKTTLSASSETTQSTTPTTKVTSAKTSAVKPASSVLFGQSPFNLKTDTGSSAPSSQSIFSLNQNTNTTKASTDPSKPLFPSEPDENELGTTTDDNTEGEEGDYEDDEEGEYEEEEEESDEREEDEGSGVDVAEEIAGNTASKLSTDSSFGRQGSSLTDGSWSNVKGTFPSQKSLFGDVQFPPKQPDNERSPSPERRKPAGKLQSEPSRSLNVSRGPTKQKIGLPRTMKQSPKPQVAFQQRREQEHQRIVDRDVQKKIEEEQPLEEDVEDQLVSKLLNSDIEPTTELEGFIAHQDYTGPIHKQGVPAQIERIYRDINSMIDTIGLNCRNLSSFTQGHEEGYKDGRELDDLAEAKNWTLVEVQDLVKIQRHLAGSVDAARIENVDKQLEIIEKLQTDIKKMVVHQKDLRDELDVQLEDSNNEVHRDVELSTEQTFQRDDIRAKLKAFQQALTEAESATALLRTKLATTSTGSRGNALQNVPTVEAIINTIRKFTAMIEKSCGDIDVQEARMRKLGISPLTPSASRAGSREGSPFATPNSSQRHRTSLLASGGLNNASPLRNGWRASTSGLRDSVNSSSSVAGTRLQRQKKLAEYTAGDVEPFVARAERKKVLMGHLRDALVGKNGEKTVNVVALE